MVDRIMGAGPRRLLLLLLLLSVVTMAQPAKGPSRAGVEKLAWLTGCWGSTSGNRDTSEHWMKPAGDTMLGMSRTVVRGKTVAVEFMQVRREENGDVYFIAKPSGQGGGSFKLTKSGPQEATFENPEHDFPQRIIYRLVGSDSLFARIEGRVNGQPRGEDFHMKRASCE